jgi:hypothetical protein
MSDNLEAKLSQDQEWLRRWAVLRVQFERENEDAIDQAVGAAIVSNPKLILDALAALPREELIELGFAAKIDYKLGVANIASPAIAVFLRQRCIRRMMSKKYTAEVKKT